MKVKINISNLNIILYMAKCFSTENVVNAINILITNPKSKLGKKSVYVNIEVFDRDYSQYYKELVILSKAEVDVVKEYLDKYYAMETHQNECWITFNTDNNTQTLE